MSNELEEATREAYPEDPSKRMEQGKSLLASIVGNPVTLHRTVDRKSGEIKGFPETTKDPHTHNKPARRRKETTLSKGSSMTGTPNNALPTGCWEAPTKMMM
jgi:hypothetical protein